MSSSTECPSTSDPSKLVIGLALVAGLIFSYAPQIHLLFSRKNSSGLNSYFLLLGIIGSATTLGNVLILQQPSLKCCLVQPFNICLQDTMAITQIFTQFGGFAIIVAQFFLYVPPEVWASQTHGPLLKNQRLIITFGLSLIVAVVSMVIIVDSSSENTNTSQKIGESWAQLLGSISLMCGIIQYLPQLHQTLSQKSFGALSIQTLAIQAPGSWLFVYSLTRQPGTNWSTWITYAVCGIFQCLLVGIWLWLWISGGRGSAGLALEEGNGEEEALLAGIDEGNIGAVLPPTPATGGGVGGGGEEDEGVSITVSDQSPSPQPK